jgi:hypothetical protein
MATHVIKTMDQLSGFPAGSVVLTTEPPRRIVFDGEHWKNEYNSETLTPAEGWLPAYVKWRINVTEVGPPMPDWRMWDSLRHDQLWEAMQSVDYLLIGDVDSAKRWAEWAQERKALADAVAAWIRDNSGARRDKEHHC